jgi:predicted secreted protein
VAWIQRYFILIKLSFFFSIDCFRSSHNLMKSTYIKTKAELEEIALAEADVARLKQKVAELHHQLNQQRQHHYGSLTDVGSDRYQHAQNLPQP